MKNVIKKVEGLITILGLTIVSVSCLNLDPDEDGNREKPIQPYEYPSVRTVEVEHLEFTTARIKVSLFNSQNAKSVVVIYGKDDKNLDKEVQAKIDEDGNFIATLTSLEDGCKYHFQAVAKVNKKIEVTGEKDSFITFPEGPIDLGLPSGTKWASCNLGSNIPTGEGGYYAWGETEIKNYYDWFTYKYCKNGDYNKAMTKYISNKDYYNKKDGKGVLELSDDAAHVKLGGTWRIPESADIIELIQKCAVTSMKINGVNGYKFVSKDTMDQTNFIFIPCRGYKIEGDVIGDNGFAYIASSTLYQGNYSSEYFYYGDMDRYADINCDGYRKNGFQIRPICD